MKWVYRISAISLGVATVTIFLYGMWLLCRAFLFDQFVIPTDSMFPTLIPGDKVIVDKTIMGARIYSDFNFNSKGGELRCWRTRGTRSLRHNDIVVFNFPHHDRKINFIINNVFCKRVLALPGDTIWTEDGFYKNNNYKGVLGIESEQQRFSQKADSLLPNEVLNTFPFDDEHIPYTTKNMHPVYVPRRGDIIDITPYEAAYYRMLLEWETGKQISWDWETGSVYADGNPFPKHEFKHNYYFMAGDYVLDSNDSRYWGLVPEEYIVGIVTHISYSKNRTTNKLRFDRLLKKIPRGLQTN